jgi:ArsR family metal-binding transcriptional regulator
VLYYSKFRNMSSFFSSERKFTPAQLDRIANILDNLGQVFFAVMILTPVVQGIDKTNILVLVLGTIDTVICWSGSILLAKRKDR